MRSWLLRWRVAGGFTLLLPQIRSGATLRRSAIRICLMLIASGKSSSVAKSRHIPPSKRIGGCACAASSPPTHPRLFPCGVWGSTPQPPFKGGLWWRRRLRGWGTALSRGRRCHSSGKGTKLRYARPHQAALGHARNRWAEGTPSFPRCRASGFAIHPAKGAPTMLPH